MKNSINILLILISLNSFGQDFEYLKTLKLANFEDYQNHKIDLLKSADYILSIPTDFDTYNREIISDFLLKWTGVGLKNGFQINDNISKTISIDKNLMSVYLSCIVKSVPNEINNIIEFRNIEDTVIKNYADYCKNYEFDNKELIKEINKFKIETTSDLNDKKVHKAPNRTDDNGYKQGLWKENFPDEKFEYAIINYKDDKKHGEFSAYLKNNTLYMTGNYKGGQLQGTHIIYYTNGQIKIKRNFENGLQTGTKYTYNEDGSLYSIVNFKDDKLHGSYYKYDDEGDLKWHAEYENGEEIKVTKMK